ncbi:MAG: discoidin domain-containing protein [Bacteroidota bacterium]|nr:discoidin domain-containing protein [Bacteroidota bacterium]
MKTQFRKAAFIIIILFYGNMLWSQVQYTQYDELPGIIKSYKPVYHNDFPEWAKLLYQFPVNAKEIDKKFESYMLQHEGEKSPIIRYYKIWRRATESYLHTDGTIQLPDINELRKKLLASQIEAKQKLKSASKSNSAWTFLGPKETFWLNSSGSPTAPKSCPWQVNVYSFDVSASNNDILYCGTETGYVNKTIDQGLTWQLLGQDYPFGGAVTAVVVHPTNSDIVYAAAGKQIHKTIDGGDSWTPLLAINSLFSANRLKIDVNDPQKILAAAYEGVFISTDGGVSWDRRNVYKAWDIDIKPDDSNVIYALITNAVDQFTVLMSTDGGVTYSAESFPTAIPDASGGLLAVTADNPNLLFTVLLSSEGEKWTLGTPYIYKGAFVENPSRLSWMKLATGKTDELGMDNGQGYFDLVLEVSPLDQSLILVGTTTLFKSTNGGSTFNAIGGYSGDFAIHPDIQDLKLLPSGKTWVSTDGGFSYTTDNFTSTSNYFSRNNNLIGSDMWGFDQGWNEDIVVGGRYHNGNTAIADFYQPKALRMGGAESATGWVIHGKSRHVAFNDLGNGWILPKIAEGQPEGRFIFSKYPNMVEYGGRRGNLLHHPNYYDVIYVGEGTGFWVSNDMGTSFDLYYSFPGEVRYMQISYSNPNVIYADIVGYGLYKTSNGGETWVRKPSLTDGSNGSSYWNGKLFFAISPSDGDVIYACLSNGAWSSDIGKVFKSVNGGDSWADWTGTVSDYLKCIVVQPDTAGNDLVYLLSRSRSGSTAKVYYRTEGLTDWADFSNDYPAGMGVNLALPFFRDSKFRVAGSGGVWESPLAEPDFKPIINPWVGKGYYNCNADTLYFDDHSILDHSGASWNWSISPEPVYISDPDIRNPEVLLGEPGVYSVTLTVTQDGQTYVKTIPNMVTVTTCPSIHDCSNPAEIPKDDWSLLYVDSAEPGRSATNVFDGDNGTFWHTAWSQVDPDTPHPHEVQVDIDTVYEVHSFTYIPRQDGQNGRIKDYELYISEDNTNWGTAVKTGTFSNSSGPQKITFASPLLAQYFRLVATSEVNDGPWTSVAEITLVGCYEEQAVNVKNVSRDNSIKAFPVPANNMVNISLPNSGMFVFSVYSLTGQFHEQGVIERSSDSYSLNLNNYLSGIYIIKLVDENGTIYRVKFIKE